MKIICEKGYHAGNVLRLVAEYLEKRYPDDMILDENMEITLSLKNGENGQSIVLGEKELQLSHHTADHSEDYYNHDVLTHLYTRCNYEHDLKVFQLANYAWLTCIYMDAVGLHEINNHLGHEAGDHMLRSIADGIRKYFPDDCAYRIGGDEFVLLCPARQPEELAESLAAFRHTIREMGYEVSVGVSESTDRQTLNETVNRAETAMRHDKMEFYRNNGGIRQMRIIDDKLEQLLIKSRMSPVFCRRSHRFTGECTWSIPSRILVGISMFRHILRPCWRIIIMRLCLPCVSTAANWFIRSIMTNLQSCWITAI